MRRLPPLCRVVVDNDFAGDPDGLVGLAHHLLSPTNLVTAVTGSFLNPRFAESATTAEEGARLAVELVDLVGSPARPAVLAGAEEAWQPGTRSPAAEAIVAAALAEDELPLFVVCGGPLTNVAAALEQEPGIATRMALVWIGGSLDVDAFEYNRDTDPAAADYVFSQAGLVVHQFPLETYRQCAYSVHELAEDVGTSGRVGAWLWEHYESPPEWVQLGGVWPLGDSPPVLVTALSTESSRWTTVPGGRQSSRCGRRRRRGPSRTCAPTSTSGSSSATCSPNCGGTNAVATHRTEEGRAVPMLFLNLPVTDLTAARTFYGGLGFRVHEQFSDEGSAALIVDDNVVLMLNTRDRFAELVPGEVGDPAKATTVFHRLLVDTRDEVDDLVGKALTAGGRSWQPAQDGDASYTGSFTDPDGNAWEITWLDQLHPI